MTAEQISQMIDGAWAAYSAGDLDGFMAGFAPDMVYSDNASPETLHGRDAFKAYVAGWIQASSDGRITPTRTIVSGNRAAVELHAEFTHDRAPFYGVAPSGARVVFDFAMFVDVADGKIVKVAAYYNPATIMQFLGIMGTLPSRPADTIKPSRLDDS